MFKFLALMLFVLVLAAVVAPQVREAVGWVLAFFSLLMLGDLVRGSLTRRRGRGSPQAPAHPRH